MYIGTYLFHPGRGEIQQLEHFGVEPEPAGLVSMMRHIEDEGAAKPRSTI
jgi:hypothetical protein